MKLCENCGKVELDEEDNTIRFLKNGKLTMEKVCSNCYFDIKEV